MLLAAEEWHTPPWVIEDGASQEWWERYVVLRNERAEFDKKRRKKKGDNSSLAEA